MTLILLVMGGVLGTSSLALALHFFEYRMRILAVLLCLAAIAYVFLALRGASSSSWIELELLGVALYSGFAALSWRGSTWWLVVGWALHPIWDLLLHYFRPDQAFAPATYTIPCVSFDLIVAGYLAFAATRRSAHTLKS